MPVIHQLSQLILHWCPGCKREHAVHAERWNWNEDTERPTLSPSVLHFTSSNKGKRHTLCHYFIKDGQIQFCGDCPHEFASRTVPLEQIELNHDPDLDQFHIIRPQAHHGRD